MVQRGISFLARWSLRSDEVSLWSGRWRAKAKRIAKNAYWCAATAFLCVVRAQAASVTITGPANLQADIIAISTSTYIATITPSAFFAGSYTVNLVSKKPAVPPVCPACPPAICDLDKDIALMVQNSTYTYVYGFANGQAYERYTDLNTIWNLAVACSTNTACSQPLGEASRLIDMQNYAPPTVIDVP